MDSMNAFQQLWKQWEDRVNKPLYGDQYPQSERAWINELNQAIFSRLEKILPTNVKVRTAGTPAFLYYVEAPGGYGVDARTGVVFTHLIKLPKNGTFEERVDCAVSRLQFLIEREFLEGEVTGGPRTAFFYAPVVPICEKDNDGDVNRHQMSVRLRVTGATVDVEERDR